MERISLLMGSLGIINNIKFRLIGIMFLSKKIGNNVVGGNKSKKGEDRPNKRVLGGWQDDQQQPQQNASNKPAQKQSQNAFSSELLASFHDKPQKNTQQKQTPKPLHNLHYYYTWDQLNSMQNISIQQRIIQELIQPGGIRIKPADNTLLQFSKEINGLSIEIIGSLLLSKIEVNYPFQIKAKSLYVIEYLSKRRPEYLQYFKVQLDKIKEFSQPEDNVDNYRKILKSVVNYIGKQNDNHQKQEMKVNFIDPGYNQPEKSSIIGTFIKNNGIKQNKSEGKRPIVGPEQLKRKQIQEKRQKIIENTTHVGEEDLISIEKTQNNGQGHQEPIKKALNYDEILQTLSKQSQHKPSQNLLNLF